MEILVIILILVLIVQTAIYTYSHFFDINSRKESAATIKMFETATNNFVADKETFNRVIAAREATIDQQNQDYRKLAEMHNMVVHYLPNIRQKEAMKHVASNTQTQDDIDTIAEYYNCLKNIKYNDEEKPLKIKI